MGTSPFTVFGVCILLIWVLTGEFFRQRRLYLKASWLWPVFAMIALMWLGLLYSPDLQGLGVKFAKKSHYWLYAMALVGLPGKGKNHERLIKWFLAGLAVNVLIGFLQLIEVAPIPYRGRYTGLSSGYNTLALLLNAGILVSSFYFRFARERKTKMVYLSLVGAYFFHLVILEGRAGYLVFACLSPLIAFNLSHGRHLLVTFLLFLLAVGLMSSSPTVQQKVIDTIYDVRVQFKADDGISWGKHYSEDDRLQRIDRIFMWRWAVDLFLERPLTGVGTGGYKKSILERGGERGIDHPHNNILYMAVSFGVGGLLVLGWYFWVLLRNGWKNRFNPLGFFVFTSGLVMFLGGLADTTILDSGSAFFMAVSTGLQAALPGAEKR